PLVTEKSNFIVSLLQHIAGDLVASLIILKADIVIIASPGIYKHNRKPGPSGKRFAVLLHAPQDHGSFQAAALQTLIKILVCVNNSAYHGASILPQFPLRGFQKLSAEGIHQDMFPVAQTAVDSNV